MLALAMADMSSGSSVGVSAAMFSFWVFEGGFNACQRVGMDETTVRGKIHNFIKTLS